MTFLREGGGNYLATSGNVFPDPRVSTNSRQSDSPWGGGFAVQLVIQKKTI